MDLPLVARAREGDPEPLLAEYGQRLYALAFHMLESPDEAESAYLDAVEVLLGDLDDCQGAFFIWALPRVVAVYRQHLDHKLPRVLHDRPELLRLKPAERLARLLDLEGFSPEEIAVVLGRKGKLTADTDLSALFAPPAPAYRRLQKPPSLARGMVSGLRWLLGVASVVLVLMTVSVFGWRLKDSLLLPLPELVQGTTTPYSLAP